jgi:hypothetical protein
MDVSHACARRALEAGDAIRAAVHALPVGERAKPQASRLKAANVRVDAVAEDIGLERLAALAAEIDHRILLLLDDDGAVETLGRSSRAEAVWVCFDAIDGTKKLAGIEPFDPRRLAAANDGAWATTFAFTPPTAKGFEDLVLGDFDTAAVIDGNPTRWRSYPQEVVALADGRGGLETWEVDGAGRRRLYTTSCERLGQCFVFLDSFQAFDRASADAGDERRAVELYRRLIDRHAPTGGYDVLRQFGSLSALCRLMLGWREEPVWLESQGGAFLVVNENLPNLIPAVAVIAGAGGSSVDFDGRALAGRRLAEGRTSVIHAANAALRDTCLAVAAVC